MRATATCTLGGGQYEKIVYPAGETQVRFSETIGKLWRTCEQVNVIARIHNAQDLIETRLLVDAACQVNVNVNLLLPYLPYGRADRRFTNYDCYGLQVIEDLFGPTDADRYTLDVHSKGDVFIDLDPIRLIQRAVNKFMWRTNEGLTVLFPDEGARERYSYTVDDMSGNLGIAKPDLVYCKKKRDKNTGELLKFEVPRVRTKHVLIIDDICDGGGTFLGIRQKLPKAAHVGLYVTHGIFSKGIKPLTDAFDVVYTTNSFKEDYGSSKLVVLDGVSEMLRQIMEEL